MSIYRKTESGQINKTAGNLVQRFNDRIFLTTHSVVGGADYYDIELAAKKYILKLDNFTEYQLYFAVPNETDNIYVRYQGRTLHINRSDNDPIAVGALYHRVNLYTLDSVDNKIWMDPLLQPTPDSYKGLFTYALDTWNAGLIPDPELDQTAVALDTNMTYKYNGTVWNETGLIDDPATGLVVEPLNGWYWMIEYFPNRYFGNGKIVWNGGTNSWNIFTARVPRPDEVTITTDPATNKFAVASIPSALLNAGAVSYTGTVDASNVNEAIEVLNSNTQDIVVELPNTDWTGTSAPYSKSITVAGILATDKLIVDVDLSEVAFDDVSAVQSQWGNIYRVASGIDTITFYASIIPSVSLNILVKVVR